VLLISKVTFHFDPAEDGFFILEHYCPVNFDCTDITS
jgi:hypothetical protein